MLLGKTTFINVIRGVQPINVIMGAKPFAMLSGSTTFINVIRVYLYQYCKGVQPLSILLGYTNLYQY